MRVRWLPQTVVIGYAGSTGRQPDLCNHSKRGSIRDHLYDLKGDAWAFTRTYRPVDICVDAITCFARLPSVVLVRPYYCNYRQSLHFEEHPGLLVPQLIRRG